MNGRNEAIQEPSEKTGRSASRCRICSSADLQPLPFGYDWDARRFDAVHCRECGGIFLEPQPDDDDLVKLYTREYFEKDFRCGHAGSYFETDARNKLGQDPVLDRIARLKSPPARFLEIGCAGGAYLAAARSKGYEVQGVEFSDQAAAIARETYGLNVFTGDIRAAGLDAGSVDIAYLGDVIEHLRDPVSTLGEIRRVLRRNGLVVIVCPTQTNTLFSRLGFGVYRMLGMKTTVQLPPYHVFEYRPASMTALLERTGFRIVEMRRGIMTPSEIALRGSFLHRSLKKIFQYPNFFLTTISGFFGDRLEIFAVKV